MRALAVVLGVVAAIIVVVGAVNHATMLRLDYLLGTSPRFSLFWLALGAAALVVLAGVVGGAMSATAAGSARRKLEVELEDTYKRLRAAQTQASAAPYAAGVRDEGQTEVVATAPRTTVTAVRATDLPDDTVAAVAADTETGTVAAPAAGEADTIIAPPGPTDESSAAPHPDAPDEPAPDPDEPAPDPDEPAPS